MRSPNRFRTPRPAGLVRRVPFSTLAATAVLGAATLAACSGGNPDAARTRNAERSRAGCGTLDSAAVLKQAVTQFITVTDPKPLRFLYMAGTDSMLPEAGTRALQDKGPTYLWPADARQQPIVTKRLEDAGPWNALLVTYRGIESPTPTTARVRIGGTWIGVVDHGKQLGVKAVSFECSTAGDSAHTWRMTGVTPEASAEAPGAPATSTGRGA